MTQHHFTIDTHYIEETDSIYSLGRLYISSQKHVYPAFLLRVTAGTEFTPGETPRDMLHQLVCHAHELSIRIPSVFAPDAYSSDIESGHLCVVGGLEEFREARKIVQEYLPHIEKELLSV